MMETRINTDEYIGDETRSETFCMKRGCLWIALLGIVMFSFCGIVFVFCGNGHANLTAFCFSLFSFCLVSVYIWLLLAVKRHRLTVSQSHVEFQGVWKTRRIVLDDVREFRWRKIGSVGRLTLKTSNNKLGVDLGEYGNDASRKLIRYFRFRLPQEIQKNWQPFWKQYWRLFELPDESDSGTAELFATRRRMDRLFLIGGFASVFVLGYIWWLTDWHYVIKNSVFLAMLAFLWWWLRRTVPRRGKLLAEAEAMKQQTGKSIDLPALAEQTYLHPLDPTESCLAWENVQE